MSINGVYLSIIRAKYAVHGFLTGFRSPVGTTFRRDDAYVGIVVHGFHKSTMAILHRRRGLQTLYLHNHALASYGASYIVTKHLAELDVIGAHERGVFLTTRLAVEEHHRNAVVVGLADNVGEA